MQIFLSIVLYEFILGARCLLLVLSEARKLDACSLQMKMHKYDLLIICTCHIKSKYKWHDTTNVSINQEFCHETVIGAIQYQQSSV